MLNFKDTIKRLNSENTIIFKPQKFSQSLINFVDIKINLAYGRLNITKNLLISDSKFMCNGVVNLLKEYPIYYFDCSIKSPDKKKLLNIININNDLKDKQLNLFIKGNLNIFNKKINFDNIETDEQYKAIKGRFGIL